MNPKNKFFAFAEVLALMDADRYSEYGEALQIIPHHTLEHLKHLDPEDQFHGAMTLFMITRKINETRQIYRRNAAVSRLILNETPY